MAKVVSRFSGVWRSCHDLHDRFFRAQQQWQESPYRNCRWIVARELAVFLAVHACPGMLARSSRGTAVALVARSPYLNKGFFLTEQNNWTSSKIIMDTSGFIAVECGLTTVNEMHSLESQRKHNRTRYLCGVGLCKSMDPVSSGVYCIHL